MADKNVHQAYGTPEYVAWLLFQEVVNANRSHNNEKEDKKWILDNYASCLKAAKGYDWEEKQNR